MPKRSYLEYGTRPTLLRDYNELSCEVDHVPRQATIKLSSRITAQCNYNTVFLADSLNQMLTSTTGQHAYYW